MRRTRRSYELLAALIALLTLTACAPRPDDGGERVQRQLFAMDTVMLLTAYGPQAGAALDAAAERIGTLEADLDPESVTGSIYALNAGTGGPVAVSEDAYGALSVAMEYYAATDGALDPGLYPVLRAWGFAGGEYRVPSGEEIRELLARKDTGGIAFDAAAGTVALPAGTAVSLGAVAKGCTAQAVVELMADMGVEHAVLSLGGNVQTLGDAKPDGSPWQIAVTDPHDTGSYVGVLSLGQAAVVTSGGYQRYFEEDGVTYIHILDPATGYPVQNGLLSVTVVTEDGAAADALSTALFVMGRDAALDYYEREGGFELILITDEDEVVVTPGLRDVFAESGEGYTYEYYGYSE